AHAAAAEDGLDFVTGHGNRSARRLRLRALRLGSLPRHVATRAPIKYRRSGCLVGGNFRARWSRAYFVVGGAEGIARNRPAPPASTGRPKPCRIPANNGVMSPLLSGAPR